MIKSIVLSIVLSVSFIGVVHAQDNNNKSVTSKKEKKNNKKVEKKQDDDVTYLDLSGPAEDENAMPAITPKGKL